MRTLWQDMRYGSRMILKNPGFTLVAALTLALGIGANTAIFSIVNGILLRPEAVQDPERLVVLWSLNSSRSRDGNPVSPGDFAYWREQSRSFESLSALTGAARNLSGAVEPERLQSYRVSINFFPLLGVQPMMGRSFTTGEDQVGNNRVVVLSHGLWRRRFGADPGIVGKTITLDRESHTVIGVMPQDLRYPPGADIWEPLAFNANQHDRGDRFLVVIGRLKPGVNITQAQTEMGAVASRIAQQFPDTNAGWGIDVRSFEGQLVSHDARIILALFFLATGFILLIACVNVANLQLARAAARRKEFAIRSALGAGRFRLIRQLLAESLTLALLGGASGALLSLWGKDLLRARYASVMPLLEDISIDGAVLGFALLLSMLTAIFFGLAPAIRASKPDLNEELKEGSRGSEGGWRGRRSRSVFMASQVALAVMLLIVAGLLIRTLIAFQSVEPGFNPHNLLTARISLLESSSADENKARTFYQQVLARVSALPGVQSAGAIDRLPLTGSRRNPNRNMEIEGRPAPSPNDIPWARDLIVSQGYFEALELPLLRGRRLSDQDLAETLKVAVISETAAGRYWTNEDPLGKRVKIAGSRSDDWITIVGVVGDVRNDDVDAPPLPQIYLPHAQHPRHEMALVVRTAADPLGMAANVRNAVWSVAPDQPIYQVASMKRLFFEDLAGPFLLVELFSLFAVIALVLATAGMFGVISYVVSQQTREIGIRIALGASGRDIFKQVIGRGLLLILIGVGLGLAGAFALGQLLSSLFWGVSGADPLTFISVSCLLTVTAMIACIVPARRATKVDPIVALRCE